MYTKSDERSYERINSKEGLHRDNFLMIRTYLNLVLLLSVKNIKRWVLFTQILEKKLEAPISKPVLHKCALIPHNQALISIMPEPIPTDRLSI